MRVAHGLVDPSVHIPPTRPAIGQSHARGSGETDRTARVTRRNGLLRTHPRHSPSRERALYFAGPQMLRASAVWELFARERIMRARKSPPLEVRVLRFQPAPCSAF